MSGAVRALATAAALVALPVGSASAEVLRSTPEGFAASRTESFEASPAEVWAEMMQPAKWWSGDHSWSGDAANFSLDPRAGGCFCESLPDGGSVEHMRVINAAPGRMLRMVGALGPLQSESLTAVLTVTLEPEGEGAKLTWIYKVSGVSDIPLSSLAPAVEGVVGQQFATLASRLR